MSSLSRRTQHVVKVVRRVKDKTVSAIQSAPEGSCSEECVADFVVSAYPEVAKLHGVNESTVRAACTRSLDIASSREFGSLVMDSILGGGALADQLADCCKRNESPSDIRAAFANL